MAERPLSFKARHVPAKTGKDPRRWKRKSAFLLAGILMLSLLVVLGGCGKEKAAEVGEEYAPMEVVRLHSGPIRGVVGGDGIAVYKGVPYAAPPVGERRWKEPQDVDPWEDILPCIEEKPVCTQVPWPYEFAKEFYNFPNQSEDCLYLNVWTPARSTEEKLPVMVWIHGGAFVLGAGSQPLYDGRKLASKGVVVVTFNYRLGPLGFMAHPLLSEESPHGVSGNYGLLDMIQALKWVQRNIAAFGGDPGNVTVFGQSAGGASVCCLMASPLAEGLFHRAIVESGGFFPVGFLTTKGGETLQEAENYGKTISSELGCEGKPDELAALREKDAREVVDAFQKVEATLPGALSIGPIVDGYVLPDHPYRIFAAGKQNKVPLLIGTVADEGTMFVAGQEGMTAQQYQDLLRTIFGEHSDEAYALYPVAPGEKPVTAYARLFTGLGFAAPSRHAAECMARDGMPVYVYKFSYVSTADPTRAAMGAYHGSEIAFVFGSSLLDFAGSEVKALSGSIMSYWINFATTGDPNGGALPEWPAFGPGKDTYQELNLSIASRSGYYAEDYALVKRMRGI